MKLSLLTLLLFISFAAGATNYYVDAATSASLQNGSSSNPWKTLSQVNSNMSLFNPGDFILFKRGGTYTGTLSVTRSGTSGSPITFGAFGSGNKPVFTGTGSTINTLFYVNSRSYVIFRDWNITDPSIDNSDRSIDAKIQRAFTFDGTTNNCKIIACDIELVGVAAYFVGGSNTMDQCDVGNLRMVVDTDQGYQPGNDDDYGANPLVISSANNTITNNNFHDCWATSFDYGYDGGAIELYGSGTNNNFIAYNTISDCIGLSEVTGNSSNNTYAYNKLINVGSLFYFQSGATYSGYYVYNNVIVENVQPRVSESRMIGGSITAGAVVLKNNVFQLSTGTDVASSASGITHEDNIYKVSNNSIVGFTLHSTELTTATNSLFSYSASTNPVSWDFAPVSGSPIIGFGQQVGLTRDFAGNSIAAVPNAGILEGGSGGSASTLMISAIPGTISCNGGTTTVSVSGSGGTAPYSGTGTFTAGAGTFNYTITDAAGASKSATVTISQPSVITLTLSAGTITTTGGTTTLTAAATGGSGTGYSYSRNGGAYQASASFTGVGTGVQTISVKDSKGCTAVKSITLVVNGSSALNVTAVAGTISCYGDSATVTVSATGGTAPYTGTGNFRTVAGTRIYTVTDAAGFSQRDTVIITQPVLLTATVAAGTIATTGGTTSLTVTAAGGTAGYTYKLNNGAYQVANVFSNISAGIDTVTVKDSKGCTAVKIVTIAQPAALGGALAISLVSSTGISCSGKRDGRITVSASGGTAPYQFKTPWVAYTTDNYFTNLMAGTYLVTVKDAKGATASISVVVAGSKIACTTAKTTAATVLSGNSIVTADMEVTINTYPNPSAGSFSLEIKSGLMDDVEVEVMDLNGVKVYQEKGTVDKTYSFGQVFKPGVYFVRVIQGAQITTSKIIKL